MIDGNKAHATKFVKGHRSSIIFYNLKWHQALEAATVSELSGFSFRVQESSVSIASEVAHTHSVGVPSETMVPTPSDVAHTNSVGVS